MYSPQKRPRLSRWKDRIDRRFVTEYRMKDAAKHAS